MTSTLKCFDKQTGKNKCPDQKNPKKVYCDTRSGKCYTATKYDIPHGFAKQQEADKDKGATLIFDKKYKLFGYDHDVQKHIKAFEQPKKEITTSVIATLTVPQLKELAKEVDPNWNVPEHTGKGTLISAIKRKQVEKIAQKAIEESKEEDKYVYDELDKYDIWTNELTMTQNPRLIEYVPYSLKQITEQTLHELRSIWK
jgi:hypothetical protein